MEYEYYCFKFLHTTRSDNKVHVSNQKIKIPFLMNENSFDAKLSKTLLQKIKL